MFRTLLESGVRRKASERWLSASTGLHAILFAGALTLTPRRPPDASGSNPECLCTVMPTYIAPKTSGGGSAAGPTDARGSLRVPLTIDVGSIVGVDDIVLPGTNDIGSVVGSNILDAASGEGLSDGDGTGPMSVLTVDKPAVPLPGNAKPVYPTLLRNAGVTGSVTMQFVIDTAGAVEPSSIKVLRADNELFVSAVRSALARSRFLAAEVAGRKVRMLVEQRFDFAIEGL